MTKTVSYANVHLTYTADAAGLRQAKADMAAMNRVINQTKTDTQKYEEHVQKLDRLLANGKISQEQYNRALDAARTKFLTASQAAKGYSQTLASMNLPGMGMVGMGPIGATGAAFALTSAAGISMAKQSVQAYGELQMTMASLEVIYGDAGKAARDFATMRQMAAVSPLETRDFTRAATVMAQYGVAIDRIVPTLSRISEVAAGDSEKMFSLSLAFGQVAANGRLMGQEVLQMVNAGFNPLAEIARTTGRDMRDLRKDMENGLITFDMVAKAFETATEAGGRFNGMNEKLGETIPAKLAQLRDEYTKLKEVIGESLASGGVVDMLNATSTALKGLNEQLSLMNKYNVSISGMGFLTDPLGEMNRFYNFGQEALMQSTTAADIERMGKEADDLQKAQERFGKSIADAISSVPSAIQSAGQTYAGAMNQFEELAREGAQSVIRADIKRRAEAEEKRKQEMQDMKLTAELPRLATYGSVEAFNLMSEMAQRKADMQLEQLRKNEEIAVKQVDLLTTIKDNTGKPQMGIVK